MIESSIYDIDGLFHNIVKESEILQGRYHVLPRGTHDLNTNNITGLDYLQAGTKYPLSACLPPTSVINPTLQKGQWEYFNFRILFLCSTDQSEAHQINTRNLDTYTSDNKPSLDWSSMKALALNFINAVEILQSKTLGRFQLDDRNQWRITRLTKIQNDQVSGVLLSFIGMIAVDCSFSDININSVTIPE